MIDFRDISQILGWLIFSVSLILIVPAMVDLAADNRDWSSFAFASAVAAFFGILLILSNPLSRKPSLNLRQAFILIALGWVLVTIFGAVPFVGAGLSVTDAVFETMSGITTTGSTILTGLDSRPPGILLWRAVLQWLGGIGIIAVAVMILPLLRVGGMQLFKIETSRSVGDENIFTAKMLLMLTNVYIGLTVLCALVYYVLGMSEFDAITHAMTTLSTGGYSTHDASFGYFTDYRLQWAGTLFMICGGIPFVLFVKVTQGNFRALFTDQQVRGFILFLVFSSVLMTFWLIGNRDISVWEALTLTSFNITSVVTTTGFASDDYTAWGQGAVGVFLVLMFVGGCAGSTSGAIKIYRYQVLWLFVRAHVRRLFSPHRVIPLKYNRVRLADDVPSSILAFLAVYIATISVFTLILTLLDIDLITAYSATITSVSNVGPGLGNIIGPSGTFQTMPDTAKWVLVSAMLAGRLEILTLLVFFERDFWIS